MSADKAEKQANDGEADDKPIPSLFATIHFKSDERPDGYTAEDIAELNEKANAGGGTSSKPMDWRWIAGAGVGVLIAVCAVAVGLSPTWMPGRIVRAAEAGDRAALERLIDFAAVRSSLETDMKDLMASFYRRELASTGDAFAMMFSGLGMSVIDVSAKSMAEQIATPLSLEKAVSGEDVWVDVMGEPRNFLPEFRHRGGDYAGFSVEGRYLSFSKYEYRLRSRDTDRAFDVQMRRTGPLSWRIDRVRVDSSMLTSIQRDEASQNTTRTGPPSGAAVMNDDGAPDEPRYESERTDENFAAPPEGDERIWSLYQRSDCGDLIGPERAECWAGEEEFQDRQLNAEYAALRSDLGRPERERLRQLQLAWIDRRDAACEKPDFGSAGWAMPACRAAETAERRIFLQDYGR